jgi:ADP-ribose pyrophosphatase YjhB (NUDIX family)
MNILIRATGVLVEEGHVLLVKQDITATRHWALPGGRQEVGETLDQCLIRELKEETGLDVAVGDLLYITDRILPDSHVVHITFLLRRTGGTLLTEEELRAKKETVRKAEMVPLDQVEAYGMTSRWRQLAESDFPERGSYRGDYVKFYGGA